MRYMIAETSWDMMSLAQDILGTGTLLTRTDRPEDLIHFLALGVSDLVLIEADQIGKGSITLRELRAASGRTPVVLLSADASSKQKAEWFSEGADAIIDPNQPNEEILHHLMAVARRALGFPMAQVDYGPLRLDLNKRMAHINGCPVKMSPKIYEMLEFIALRPGQVVTRDALLNHIYGLEGEPETRIFDVYACNIRSCLKATANAVELETVRGAGFRLSLNVTVTPEAA